MVIAIERNRFNILYKYDQISIALSSIIDSQMEELQSRLSIQQKLDSLVRDLDRILPVFELDHEVLLLEIDKSKVGFSSEITVSFDSIVGIYPLTREGANLLVGKLNDNIKVSFPSLEQAVQRVKGERTIRLRVSCAKKLLDLFGLKVPINQKFRDTLQATIRSIVYGNGNGPQYGNFIYSLLTYDKTPSYIPSGNAEFITKVGVITLIALNKDDAIIKNGSLYKKCLDNRNLINRGSIFEGLTNFETLLDDSELKNSYEKVIDSINPKFDNLPIFRIAYYFIALKAYLNKNEKNLLGIAQQLFNETQKDTDTFAHVLLLIGYTFSYEELYESIHALEQAQILKNKVQLREYKREETLSKAIISQTKTAVEEQPKQLEQQIVSETASNANNSQEKVPNTEKEPGKSFYNETKIENETKAPMKLEITNFTVRDFEKWLQVTAPKGKQKKWTDFMSVHFPVKDDFISPDDLANAINKTPSLEFELFSKGKNKFDKAVIVNGFFKK